MALPATITRSNGNDAFVDMQRDFDALLGRLFGNAPQTTSGRRSAPYAVDVQEDDHGLYFDFELPGFKKEEIDITVDSNVLTVTAERKEVETKRETLLNERRYTYFSRSFSLPPTVASDQVEAKLADGVLHLQLAKKEETKPRKIAVS